MRFVGAILIFAACIGCNRPGDSASAPRLGGPSTEAREIRYNAALALANRGSPRVKDDAAWEAITEMLDEEKQLRNFQTPLGDGRSVPDETAARMTVISALRSLQVLHKKQPSLDLKELKPAIEKLTQSTNATVRAEAKKANDAIFPAT